MQGIPAGGLKDFNLERAIREWRTRLRWQEGLAVDQIKEIEDHLRSRIEELVADGLAPREALSVALRRLGETKGLAHDNSSTLSAFAHPTPLTGRLRRRLTGYVEDMRQDLRIALRSLVQRPWFVVAAAFVIAVGIGTNTAAFGVANAVLFRPLPLPAADRLVSVAEFYPGGRNPGRRAGLPNIRSWEEHSDLFVGFAAAGGVLTHNLTGSDAPEALLGREVSTDFFNVLATPPVTGRLFRDEDGRPGAEPVVLLGERFWRRRFAADPGIVGKTIHLEMQPYTVIGVVSSFTLYPGLGTRRDRSGPLAWIQEQDFWLPIMEAGAPVDAPARYNSVSALARLKEGVSVQQARAEIERLGTIARPRGHDELPFEAHVEPVERAIGARFRQPLFVLMGAAGLVLLIMCANVANLLLSRTLTRRREIAVRGALGASRGRLTRQLLTEAVPLVVLGGGLGAFGAWWAVNLLLTSNPTHRLPILIEAGVPLDGAVSAFTLAAVTLTVLLCGVPPAAAGARADLHEALKGSGDEGGKRRRQSLRALLVGSEVALAMVLVTAGGLLTNSFWRVANLELGFEPNQAIAATPVPPTNKYGEWLSPEFSRRLGALYREILEGAQAIPGVESVGLCFMLPLTPGPFSQMPINIEGRPELWRDGEYVGKESQDASDYADTAAYARATYRAEVTYVSPGYFRAAGVPLIRGEYFTEAGPGDPKVVVISESAARHYFPDDDPIGQRISVAVANTRGLESWAGWRTVVGIVADVRNGNLEVRPIPQVYVPHEQIQLGIGMPSLILRARDGIDPRTLADELEAVVSEVDPDVAVDSVLPLEDLLSRQLGQRRLYLALVMVFAACAILLATVGVSAVVAYATSQRTHEIGVRRALGARGSDVVGLILRQGLGVVLVGVAVGTAAAWSLSGILSSFLYEIAPTDPLTFLIAAATVVAVALPACLIPARRAARVDPLSSLRAE